MDASSETNRSGFIDLSSDTATRPSADMRRFMAAAPVGDDQRREDPSVNALQDEGAALLGKEAALFLPSATMANQIAIRTHTRPGDEVICHEHAHIRLYEGGGPALLSGCQLCPLPGEQGLFTVDALRRSVRPPDPHFARSRLVSLENTHNYAGGTVLPLEDVQAITDAARGYGLALHLDGARLLNAAVKLSVSPAEIAAPFDTVTLCLSKGLGAPVGALLLGDAATIAEARRWKHVFGGAMRQAGIVAAGGLYALRHNIPLLAVDHANASRLAEGLAEIPDVRLDPAPETNIVYFDVACTGWTGAQASERLLAEGVRVSGPTDGRNRMRFVTHLDVSAGEIEQAIAAARRALAHD